MIIRLNDLSRQNNALKSEFAEVLFSAIDGNNFILRDYVTNLESNVRGYLKAEGEVIGINSGTDGLLLGLYGAGLKPGDEVIVPSRTYIASVATIIHLKLVPRFIDIADDLNLDAELLEREVCEFTKAIMPVHLSGHACDMSSISRIAQKYGLKIIEDAAPAFGCMYGGQHVGTHGDFGVFSLHPLKVFGVLGDGGLIVAKQLDAPFLRLFRDHGHPQPKSDENFLTFGVNSRLDNIQAGFACVKLRLIDKWIARRRSIAEFYSRALIDSSVGSQMLKHLENMKEDSIFFDTFSSFVLCIDSPEDFSSFMIDEQSSKHRVSIETARDFPRPINSHPNLQKELSVSAPKYLEKTEYFARRAVKVPIYPELEDSEVEDIAEKMKIYFDQNN